MCVGRLYAWLGHMIFRKGDDLTEYFLTLLEIKTLLNIFRVFLSTTLMNNRVKNFLPMSSQLNFRYKIQ
jgi:hypothetical protein